MTTETTVKDCHDCGAEPGAKHGDNCDTAVCLWTGAQRLSCDGWSAEIIRFLRPLHAGHADTLAGYFQVEEDHDCGEDTWTGEWPGKDDAARLGFWCYWGPDFGSTGWVECNPDHPGTQPDLNRLNPLYATWDRNTHRWEHQ